jgi:hypothetical protein
MTYNMPSLKPSSALILFILSILCTISHNQIRVGGINGHVMICAVALGMKLTFRSKRHTCQNEASSCSDIFSEVPDTGRPVNRGQSLSMKCSSLVWAAMMGSANLAQAMAIEPRGVVPGLCVPQVPLICTLTITQTQTQTPSPLMLTLTSTNVTGAITNTVFQTINSAPVRPVTVLLTITKTAPSNTITANVTMTEPAPITTATVYSGIIYVTQPGSIDAGSNNLTFNAEDEHLWGGYGWSVSGLGIPAGTTIASNEGLLGNYILLSQAATLSVIDGVYRIFPPSSMSAQSRRNLLPSGLGNLLRPGLGGRLPPGLGGLPPFLASLLSSVVNVPRSSSNCLLATTAATCANTATVTIKTTLPALTSTVTTTALGIAIETATKIETVINTETSTVLEQIITTVTLQEVTETVTYTTTAPGPSTTLPGHYVYVFGEATGGSNVLQVNSSEGIGINYVVSDIAGGAIISRSVPVTVLSINGNSVVISDNALESASEKPFTFILCCTDPDYAL